MLVPHDMTSNLGTARAIDAHAHGQPGQRTFQLRILGSNDESASLWLEKQQLQALNLAFTQLLSRLGKVGEPPADITSFPEGADHEFRVGRMSIGFDASNNTVVLHIFGEGRDEDEDDPDVLVRVTEGDCSSLNTRIQEIVAAGRPQCSLCGMPMGDGGAHACIRANGHSRQSIPEDRIEDE